MAWLFDGTNDFVTMADNAALTLPDGNWTRSILFKLDSTSDPGYDPYLIHHRSSTSAWFLLAVYSPEATVLDMVYCGLTGDDYIPAADLPNWTPNTNWNHLLIERDGDDFNLYINGSLVSSETYGAQGAINPSGLLYFGRNSGASSDFFAGALAEFAQWNRVLSSGEKSQLWNGSSGVPATEIASPVIYVPMEDDYSEAIEGLTVTNNGTSITTHPDISAGEEFEFAGSQTVSFDGSASMVQSAAFADSQAVSFDGTAAMVQTAAMTGAEEISFDGTADTVRNQWAFDGSGDASFDGTAALQQDAAFTGAESVGFDGSAALKQSAALTGSETVSFDGEAALDVAAIAFDGQGVLSFDGSIATLNAILQMEAAAAVSFDGEAQLGQQALFEGGATLSFDGIAALTGFSWEAADTPAAVTWSDVD